MSSLFGSVVSVQVGRVAPLGEEGMESAFVKRPIAGRVMADRLGLGGDEQADLRVHGGPDKAVYCYPQEHYARWQEAMPHHAALYVPGGFGENLTTSGLDEESVAIGDIFCVGGAILQVTQPRQPCLKLAIRFDDPRMVRTMLHSGRTGWYLRVCEPGFVMAGAPITLLHRFNPTWTVNRFNRLIAAQAGTADDLAELAHLPGLAHDWQRMARIAATTHSRQGSTP